MNFDVALTASQAWIFLPICLPIALWAIYTDLTELKIKNVAVTALFAGFIVLGLFALPLPEYAWRFSHFGVVLLIGFVLSAIGILGAGDAKFAAAMAPFIALPDAMLVLAIITMSAFAFMIVHQIAKRIPAVTAATPGWASWDTGRRSIGKQAFPYGIGISTGLIVYMILGITGTA
ncbi:A24 family peptidase [Gymnodinialimonas ulvae]|uniref:A24 family peptidase n=1 Tax=Gymnodinialimonas ulvae TaxID=3126504 RepID=UPI0030ADACA5